MQRSPNLFPGSSLALLAVLTLGTATATAQCIQLNTAGGTLSNRSENWDVAWEIPVPRGSNYIDAVEIYTRTKSGLAETLQVNIYLPDTRGFPSTVPARQILIRIASGRSPRFHSASLYSDRRGPQRVTNIFRKFFLVVHRSSQTRMFWPELDHGASVPVLYRRDPARQWVKLNSATHPAYKFTCRSNFFLGNYRPYGRGCNGTKGLVNQTSTSTLGRPEINVQSTYGLQNGVPNWISLFYIGVAQTSIDLSSLGAPGCGFYVNPLLVLSRTTDSSGKADFRFTPVGTTFIGRRYYTQFITLDAAANRLGLAFSNGVETLTGGTR